ncbi:MAG: DUF3109 family protein [Cytophagales bacterium]|nr:DUF3109 family protein [Cytophagales bacterium]
MIQLGTTLLSDDIKDESFVCDLQKCKGACCVEGHLGAPLLFDELDEVEDVVAKVKAYLSLEATAVLDKEGGFVLDHEGEFSTTTMNGNECAFAFYDKNKILKCSIEQAHLDGKTDFVKPISCHLYPVRLGKTAHFETVNYDKWQICSSACDLGKELKVPVYKFLKEPLIRKFGANWYDELCSLIEEVPTTSQQSSL